MAERYVISQTGMAHDRMSKRNTCIYTNITRCGSKVRGNWERIDVDDHMELITMTRPVKYCSRCFSANHKMMRLQEECDSSAIKICEWK